MHLIYENVIKNLVLLWTGSYKGLDEGTGSYHLNPTVWDAIGVATAACGSTIPTAFGARPPDVAIARRTPEFVKLINLCLQFSYTTEDIFTIRTGFAKWVLKYEQLYYQYSPDRMSACPLTIHALLHIADGIVAAGPVWAYWAFPMERFCGRLQPCIKSRRFPFVSIDGHVVATAQLAIVKVTHSLDKKLRLGPPNVDLADGAFKSEDPHSSTNSLFEDKTCALLPPQRVAVQLSPGLARKISVCLSTCFDTSVTIVNKYFNPAAVDQWAKIQRLDGGDRMLASSMVHAMEDRRDATYVRYTLLVDANARNRRLAPRFVPTDFYGQLQNIFVLTLPVAPALGLEKETTLILAAVRRCDIEFKNDMDMHYYRKEGAIEVVDVTSIQCLVGRVRTTNQRHWVIIDRSGDLARPSYDPDDN
ncbi:hypothetical protein C8J57DRAFT_1436814 [Mycena rebaudengoi]|nr:hypothetical protein C8J57DRAFT_1436814 [Mycena rebaudengoi]